MRRWASIRLSKVNTTLLLSGLALLIVAVAGPQATVNGIHIGQAIWWQRAIALAGGVVAIALGVLASREPARELSTGHGFLGTRPRAPAQLVGRPELLAAIVKAVREGERPVALVGIGGAGKSTLAAQACEDRRVRRRFRDGITWLDAGPEQDSVALLADLARRLGLPGIATAFATVGQGRDKLAHELHRKRVLIAIDNVWDRGPLDALTGLAPGCTLVFTTRLPELATMMDAAQIQVDELTQNQALDLLGRWTRQAPAQLPDAARALCTRVSNLALGVAMTGAMVAQGRSFSDVLALIEQDLTRVRAELDPEYRHPNLLAAIGIGINDLPEDRQDRYELVAAFAGRGRFPRAAARALWQPELTDAEVGDLLAELVGRSLLTAAGEGWYIAHDLQYEVLARRLGADKLTAAHAQLLEGYRIRYPGGWASSATDAYLAHALAGHLHDAGRPDQLHALLTDVAWIQARLTDGRLPDLVPDFSYASDTLTQQILRALRMSARILAVDATQVRSQLVGRLMGHPDPDIAAWAQGLTRNGGPGSWLAPLSPALTPTTDPLMQILTDEGSRIEAVTVTSDRARVVSGDIDGSVRMWDLAAGRQQKTLISGQLSVAVTPDGATAVTGSGNGSVSVWDLAAGRQGARFTGHSGRVLSVAVTPDGATAVSGSGHMDRSVRVWDLTAGRQQAILTGHDGGVHSVAVTPDGATVVSGGADGSVRVWALLPSVRELAILTGHDGDVSSVAVTPDGATVVSGGADGSVRVWALLPSVRELAILTGHDGDVSSVAVTPDGTMAVSGAGGSVRVWDLAAGSELAIHAGRDGDVASVAVTPDGTKAVSGGADGSVRVWDLAAGRERSRLTGHDGRVRSVALTPDGATAVSGGADGSVRVWDLAAGRERSRLTGHDGGVWSVALTPDGATAVSGGADRSVRVWDLAAGRERSRLTGHDARVWSVALTPDGATAISGGADGSVRVWDLTAGRRQAILTGHGVHTLASVDQARARVISHRDPRWIRILNWIYERWFEESEDSRRERAIRDGHYPGFPGHKLTPDNVAFLLGHNGGAWSVALTPDGATAVSGGADGSVRVWDLTAGRQQAILTGHEDVVSSVAVTPDSATAVSGSMDKSVRVWNLTTGALSARWDGDYSITDCTVLPGRPLKVVVGQRVGQPYMLELRGQDSAA